MVGGGGLQDLAGLVAAAETGKAVEQLQETAEELMYSDPGGAVTALVSLGGLVQSEVGLFRQLREGQVAGQKAVLEHSRAPDRLLDYGQALFMVGRFREAREALDEALETGQLEPLDAVEALCWRSACEALAGEDGRSHQLLACASEMLTRRAKTPPPAAVGERIYRSIADLPVRENDGLSYVSNPGAAGMSGSMLGLRSSAELGMGAEDAGSASTSVESVRREYVEAKAAYEAEYERWRSESDYRNQQAGRLSALGMEVISNGVRDLDPAVHRRYLTALAAYERAGLSAR